MLSGATNMDAIEQVNVQMSAYTAEFGLKGGAQVNMITKHGGSEYKGTTYYYRRHENWNADNYFNKLLGVPRPLARYNTLGGTLGGPVPKIPKINASGNKLFFFYSVDYTHLYSVQPIRRYTMPTALERTGNFSQTRTPSGALVVVNDPLTGQPFPDNIIPANRLDPRGVGLLNVFPLPNTVGNPDFNYLFQEPSIPHPRMQHIIRVDVRPNGKDTFSGKWQTWYAHSAGYGVADGQLLSPWGPIRTRYDFTVKQGKLDYTRIINSSTILEYSLGMFQSWEDGPPESDAELLKIQRVKLSRAAQPPTVRAAKQPACRDSQSDVRLPSEQREPGAWRHADCRVRQSVPAHWERLGV